MNVPDAKPATGSRRSPLRALLTWGIPLLLAAGGAWYYYAHRFEVSTDNAYVKSDKTLVASQIDAEVRRVLVRENESVTPGQPLLELATAKLGHALEAALARREATRVQIAGLRAGYAEKQAELGVAQRDARFAEREFERQRELAARRLVAATRLDAAEQAAELANGRVTILRRELDAIAARLAGRPDADVDQHPEVRTVDAEIARIEVDLRHGIVRAPRAGVVSHLPQVGDHLTEGKPALAIVDATRTWIEANFKETDLTHVQVGQPVDIRIDTYPDHRWRGRVESISQATGAEFSVLPPQNASGNWVKIVQRVPVRITVMQSRGEPMLRSGMSAVVSIDTAARPMRPEAITPSALASR